MMMILHRINTVAQLKKIRKEYGVEVDIRSYGKRLILNHEPHMDGDDLEEYLKNYAHRFIIFNIKETGIENEVMALAEKYGIKDYFLLDVEYPYIWKSMTKLSVSKIAIRFSEYEPIEYVMNHAGKLDWVWVDVFSKLPLDKAGYLKMKKAGFKLCLVSPEQLGRPKDIVTYKEYCRKNNIIFDAVMCEDDRVKEWEN